MEGGELLSGPARGREGIAWGASPPSPGEAALPRLRLPPERPRWLRAAEGSSAPRTAPATTGRGRAVPVSRQAGEGSACAWACVGTGAASAAAGTRTPCSRAVPAHEALAHAGTDGRASTHTPTPVPAHPSATRHGRRCRGRCVCAALRLSSPGSVPTALCLSYCPSPQPAARHPQTPAWPPALTRSPC